MQARQSGHDSSLREISIALIASRDSRMEKTARSTMRGEAEIQPTRFAAAIIFRRIGGTTSLRSIQATGNAIGIAVAITSGEDIIADSSTAPGSSSTSDFIHGGRIGTTRTIITLTIT